jgi:hypothetical protein
VFIRPEPADKGVPYPRNASFKEVWCFLGYAIYASQLLEHTLLDTIVSLDKSAKAGKANLEKRTFGQLVKELEKVGNPSTDLVGKLKEANEKRVQEVHLFIRRNWTKLDVRDGRKEILDELRNLIACALDSTQRLTEEYV